MAKKLGKQNNKRIVVSLRHVVTPDGNARVSRTLDILLRAAARSTTKSQDGIKGKQGRAEDGLIKSEEGDPNEQP